jgi:hypothetical protein
MSFAGQRTSAMLAGYHSTACHWERAGMISRLENTFADLRLKIQLQPADRMRWIMIIIGMIVATQIQYIQHGWINPDSVIYLEAAKFISIGDWQSALKAFNWPLYSACIAAVHAISQWLPFSSLSIHASAQLLNVMFFSLAISAYLRIIELAGGKSLHLVIGTLIVISAQYLVGDALSMLMRDEGFWAFYLFGLLFFIRFYKYDRTSDAILWQLCILLATLFRIEAITYLLLLPLMLFSMRELSWPQKFKKYLRCNSLNLLAIFAMLTAVGISNHMTLQNFGRFQEVFTLNLYDELTKELFSRAGIMSEQVLGRFLEEFALQGLFLTFVYVIAAKIISASGLINVGLAIATMKSKNMVDQAVIKVLYTAGGLAIFNMALIIVKVFVLSSRYVLAFSWIVLIMATFFMTALIQQLTAASSKGRKWLVGALLLVLILGGIKNVLPKAADHNYQQAAVHWLETQNTAKKPVYYDDARIKYYAGAPFTGTWQDTESELKRAIEEKRIDVHEYLVITQSVKRPEKLKLIEALTTPNKQPAFQEIKRFSDGKKKKFVIIYQKIAY